MEFKLMRLGEICTVITDGSHSSPKAVSNGYPMLSVKDMGAFDFDYKGAKLISDEDYKKLVKNGCKPLKDDVLIAKDGNSCLEYCFVFREPKEVVLLSSIAILRPNKDIVNPYYLMYYLGAKSTKEELRQGYLSGSAIPRVVLKDFKLYPVLLPSLEIQNKIVSLISAINQKIESNEISISSTEQLVQTLFKHWFVNYEFPNLKGEPYKSSGGEMMQSELGLIPKDWVIKRVKDITAKFCTGLNPRKNFKLGEGQNYYVTIKNMNNNMVILDEKCDRVTDEAIKIINKRSDLQKKDILFSGIGTIGRTYFLPETPSNWNISESIFTLRNNKFVSAELLYLIFQSDDLQNYAKQLASGSVQKGIRKRDLESYKLALPKDSLIQEFTKLTEILFEKIHLLQKENQGLESLRDLLLPKLLSGEIELPDESEVTENVPVS